MEAATAPAPVVASAAKVPYTWPIVVVQNTPLSSVSDQEVAAIVHALEQQVAQHFGPAWHIGAHFEFVPSNKTPPAGAWLVALLNNSDQAGALGYHDLTPDGFPLGKVFAGTDRQYGQSVSVTLSHEVLEMLADPWINLTAQADDGKFYAWESCDAVEDDSLAYEIGGVLVSAFVTPEWFGHGAGEVCYPSGRVQQPFELAKGGYIGVFDPASGQGWTQLQAHSDTRTLWIRTARGLKPFDPPTPAELAQSVPRVGSRRERRFRSTGLLRSTYETVPF